MKLYAISDLHLGYQKNREALRAVSAHPDSWLILAGDLGELSSQIEFALQTLVGKFAKLFWVPGNHELWTVPDDPMQLRGEAKYMAMVDLCRSYGVLTPEDPYQKWSVDDRSYWIAPVFLLYDYTFRPDDIPPEGAVAWALESGIVCADENLLMPDPYPSRASWCHARCDLTYERLRALPADEPIVLINHFPLRQDLVRIPRVPRFIPWCGTRKTENWHKEFNIEVVVSGHLHVRATDFRDGVRFEEVSLGYPRQWNTERTVESYFRQILPAPEDVLALGGRTKWRP